MSQSFRIKNPKIKDLFMDIAAKERSHMEMAAQAINLLNGYGVKADKVQVGEIETHGLLGLNPGLINASGYSWTADYVTVTGDLCADLLSNIASEQRATVVYEYLYRQIEDKKVRETIDFLLNREEAHNQMFRDAFNGQTPIISFSEQEPQIFSGVPAVTFSTADYNETMIFSFSEAGSSASSRETLSTKSIPNFFPIASSFLMIGSISASSAHAIFKKLSKYICCRS